MAKKRSGRPKYNTSKLGRAHSKVSGFNKTRRNIKKLGEHMGEELQVIAVATGLRVLTSAKAKLSRPGPSRAGQPPGVDTGDLLRSVKMVIYKRFVRVGTEERHGFWQEFGTQHSKPRKWLGPAMRENKGYYGQQLKTLEQKALRRLPPVKPGDD